MAKEEPNKPSFEEKRKEDERESRLASRIVRLLIITLLGAIIVFSLLFGVVFVAGGIGEKGEVEVQIPAGSTASQVSRILEDKKVVPNAKLFSLYLRLTDQDDIKAGRYKMNKSDGFLGAAKDLKEGYIGDLNQETISIPEGSNLEQIAEIIAKAKGMEKNEVLVQMTDAQLFNSLLQKYPNLLTIASQAQNVRYRLEGYLYPATYNVNKKATVSQIVTTMVDKMNEICEKYQSDIANSPYNIHEILTLAGYIEGEAGNQEDRDMIAGVFYNRLEQNMPLQTDVSLKYITNSNSAYTTTADTQIDSAYNTYKNPGLGPGPVDSPSESSIKAALEPKRNDYLFFVADIKTGKIYYSKTYEEHQKKVEQYVSADNANL